MTQVSRIKNLWFLFIGALFLIACNVFSIPNVGVNATGDTIAFLTTTDDYRTQQVTLLDISSNETRTIGDGVSVHSAFAWHPTENKLAYAYHDFEGMTKIAIYDVSTDTEDTLITFEAEANAQTWIQQLVYSDDATKLAVSSMPLALTIDAMSLLSTEFADSDIAETNFLQSSIGYVDVETGEYTMLIRGDSDEVPLPPLAWSPNSDYLAYHVFINDTDDPFLNVFIHDMSDGTSVAPLLSDTSLTYSPTWIDNETLQFVELIINQDEQTIESSNIRHYSVNTNELMTLYSDDHAILHASLSPDGQTIAYVQFVDDLQQVVFLNVDTLETFTLGSDEDYFDYLVWHPDSDRIIISNANGVAISENQTQYIGWYQLSTQTGDYYYQGQLGTGYLGVMTID